MIVAIFFQNFWNAIHNCVQYGGEWVRSQKGIFYEDYAVPLSLTGKEAEYQNWKRRSSIN